MQLVACVLFMEFVQVKCIICTWTHWSLALCLVMQHADRAQYFTYSSFLHFCCALVIYLLEISLYWTLQLHASEHTSPIPVNFLKKDQNVANMATCQHLCNLYLYTCTSYLYWLLWVNNFCLPHLYWFLLQEFCFSFKAQVICGDPVGTTSYYMYYETLLSRHLSVVDTGLSVVDIPQ